MPTLAELFDEYCSYVKEMGLTVVDRLAGSASRSDLDRLDDYLDGETPPELRQWFEIWNGVDPTAPKDGSDFATMLFPWWEPFSLGRLLQNVDLLNSRFGMAEEDRPGLVRPFPVLLDDRTTTCMWMECANRDGKLVFYDEMDYGGYYHESLSGFVEGCLANARNGVYEINEGGIATPFTDPPHDPFLFPVNFASAGFLKKDGLPPRLPWPNDPFEGVDVTLPAPD